MQEEICNPFHKQNHLISKGVQTLNAGTARATLPLNVNQVCTPKSNNFLRETTVKRISFFLEILMLYEVYSNVQIPRFLLICITFSQVFQISDLHPKTIYFRFHQNEPLFLQVEKNIHHQVD